MKNIFSLLILLLSIISCSAPEEETQQIPAGNNLRPKPEIGANDPNKLSRVIFYPGTNYEEQFFFYQNGLLRKITKHDGTLIQDFIYDANKNLTLSHKISTWATYTLTFTYDSSNYITSVNLKPVTYNAASNKYILQYEPNLPVDPECPECYDYVDRTEIDLSTERLAINEFTYYLSSDGNYSHHGIFAAYSSNNNLGYITNWNDPSGSSYSYDNHINPLKAAMLPLCRAMAVTGGSWTERYMRGEFNSANNVVFNGYESADPETDEFVIEYNSNGRPKNTIHNGYYFGVLEYTGLYAKYYYQGETIPN
jgi:hypothetical protein